MIQKVRKDARGQDLRLGQLLGDGRLWPRGMRGTGLHQAERSSELTEPIKASLELFEAVFATQPRRVLQVLPVPCERFVIASDAALESPRQGTGGFLMVWTNGFTERREAFVADITLELYELWTPGDRKIAQLELSMVLYALLCRPNTFRNRRGVWYIDNTAALMCLIRGRSREPDLECMSHLIHTIFYGLKVWMYWEWIPSKSSWSDAISRLGWQDPWARQNDFSMSTAFCFPIIWRLPFRAVLAVTSFL